MAQEFVPNVLAERYSTDPMAGIWSPRNKTVLLRRLWILDLKIRAKLGKPIPAEAIAAYERVKDNIDFDSIAEREKVLRHDVMANIAEFNALAGYEIIHRGFTSRDETDNTEQLQILQALGLVRDRTVAIFLRLRKKISTHMMVDICGRSHLVAAQTTTLGKRFGNIAQELLLAFEDLEHFLATYPMRGIKGPMGTQQDMIGQLGSDGLAMEYENLVREELGFPRTLTCVGQVYPRALDFKALSHLAALASAMGNFSNMVRLMAGLDLGHEGFTDDQAGSSAMPHKVNSRTAERIRGLLNVLCGYLEMTSRLLGDQWFEGDVSCSVVRRVALPDAFYAIDGLYEAAMHVLDEMEIFPKRIEAELHRYLPLLSTTALLTAATQNGMGRETAHKAIKRTSMAAVKEMREGGENRFVEMVTQALQLPPEVVAKLVSRPNHGAASAQAAHICERLSAIIRKYPDAAQYNPAAMR